MAAVALVVSVESGLVPAALPLPYAVAPYASSYNAHYVNHAVAAPLVAAHAPFVAAGPAPLIAHSAYTAALPAAYPAPYIYG